MLKTLLIDDEENALNRVFTSLEGAFKADFHFLPFCNSGLQGKESILKNKPDLIFLDVDMPEMDGFQMLEELPEFNFFLVFVTSSPEFIRKAFERSGINYVIKPFRKEELHSLVREVIKYPKYKATKEQFSAFKINLKGEAADIVLGLPLKNKLSFIPVSQIMYCKNIGESCILYLNNRQKITVLKRIKELDILLPNSIFTRVHPDYIVNQHFINKVTKDGLRLTNKAQIPTSKLYKQVILKEKSWAEKFKSLFK